jgi:hypothetical protein
MLPSKHGICLQKGATDDAFFGRVRFSGSRYLAAKGGAGRRLRAKREKAPRKGTRRTVHNYSLVYRP